MAYPGDPPQHQTPGWKESDDTPPAADGADGACPSQLQENNGGLRPVGCHVWVRALVEGGQHPRDNGTGGRAATAHQPSAPGNDRMLPDDQPRGSFNGIRTKTSDESAGEPTALLCPMTPEPAAGGDG